MNTEHVTQDISTTIRKAAQILTNKSARLRGIYAAKADGKFATSIDGKAECFCLVGALECAAGRYDVMPERVAVCVYLGWEPEPDVTPAGGMVANHWDSATDEEQDAIVAKLLIYPGEPVSGP